MERDPEDSQGAMKQGHWTAEEYREFLRTGREPVRRPAASPTCCQKARPSGVTLADMDTDARESKPKRRKYGNDPVYIGWKRFDSKHEGMVYQDLMLRVKAGELKCVLRQVRFDLSTEEKMQYVADFVTIAPDLTVEVIDAKSEATRKDKVYVMKKKLMKELWGIEIQEM